ncbi:MAG: hypothetical protein OEW87_09930 [Flavobacteriaceae bacterium]|nr:hypothetical protein [Flavobacteriaceae bacterium]
MINLLDSQTKTDLKQVTSFKLELDFDGIAEFLVFGVILGNKTMIKGMTLPLYKILEIITRSS